MTATNRFSIYASHIITASINQKFRWTNAKALQSPYINMGKKLGDITCRKMTVKKGKFHVCLNVDSVANDVTSDGRLFQVFATATQNARTQTVWRRVCGTERSADDAGRKSCRPGRSATCCRLSVRYVVARPFRHRNASTASLNDIRSGARSQCRQWRKLSKWFLLRRTWLK